MRMQGSTQSNCHRNLRAGSPRSGPAPRLRSSSCSAFSCAALQAYTATALTTIAHDDCYRLRGATAVKRNRNLPALSLYASHLPAVLHPFARCGGSGRCQHSHPASGPFAFIGRGITTTCAGAPTTSASAMAESASPPLAETNDGGFSRSSGSPTRNQPSAQAGQYPAESQEVMRALTHASKRPSRATPVNRSRTSVIPGNWTWSAKGNRVDGVDDAH